MTDRLDDLAGEYRDRIRQELVSEGRSGSAAELRARLEVRLRDQIRADRVPLAPGDAERLISEIGDDLLGLGPLETLMADPAVTEVIANGADSVYAERAGRLMLEPVRFRDEPHLRQVIDRIVGSAGRRVDESSPMVDARLPDGSRVNAVVPPLAVDGALLTIRKFAQRPLTIEAMVAAGGLTGERAGLLRLAVEGRLNVAVSGATGTGKTTLLNALAAFIDPAERIVTVEDAAELRLAQPHVARLEARPANLEGAGEVTVRALVRNALRMRPDRIVVGEVRGGEALDMLMAMNTGHDGSLTTVHAGSPAEALRRIETMILMAGLEIPHAAVREQVRLAIDIVVHVARDVDGTRHVAALAGQEVAGGGLVALDRESLDALVERRCAHRS